MKLNVACPFTAQQKVITVEDAKTLAHFYDKRIAQEVAGEVLGEQYAGYVFRITGGCDKQGFPMKQGVLTQTRVRLLLKGGSTCYNPRRNGERKRKSVRGCIVGPDIAVLNVAIVKKGDGELDGLTDNVLPRRLGPKRASNIRALFMLDRQDDVRKFVIRRKPEAKDGQDKAPRAKAPKIQRLITPKRLARKRHELAAKKQRAAKAKVDAAEYHALLKRRQAEQRHKRQSHLSKKRQERLSTLDSAAAPPAAAAAAAAASASKAKKPTTTTTAAAPAAKAAPTAKKGKQGGGASAAAAAASAAAAAPVSAGKAGGAKKGGKKAGKGSGKKA